MFSVTARPAPLTLQAGADLRLLRSAISRLEIFTSLRFVRRVHTWNADLQEQRSAPAWESKSPEDIPVATFHS
jgi:hypothetical protein